MDILSYLLELLQQSKEVGITGLGTFYKKKFPGRYDKEKQSFLPPGYTLQFTTDVKDEESLTSFISGKRNISLESAKYYIAQFVEDVNKKLEIEHEAELESIGRLFYTEHEGLSFEPSKSTNYGSEFYGLPTITETENTVEELKPETQKEDQEEIYDEIAEAPSISIQTEKVREIETVFPNIENVELDEVQDDFKNTLKHSEIHTQTEIEVPDFIKEQHEENPDRFGHAPESEESSKNIIEEELDVPEFIKEQQEENPDHFGQAPESEENKNEVVVPEFIQEQHEENPNRFGHTPEVELPKTYINLHDEVVEHAEIVPHQEGIETPEFIKEQHAEHPNRFGHDPLLNEPIEEESKSIWPKIFISILILIVIGAIVYFINPELFTPIAKVDKSPTPAVIVDSPKVAIDTVKQKQDSIAKTDSILKANQVQHKPIDTVKQMPIVSSGKSMFHVIAVSYQTQAAAQKYINKVKKIGLNATIAKMEGLRKKVSIASFATREEAEKQKNILQKRLNGEGFYVKEIKNNTQP